MANRLQIPISNSSSTSSLFFSCSPSPQPPPLSSAQQASQQPSTRQNNQALPPSSSPTTAGQPTTPTPTTHHHRTTAAAAAAVAAEQKARRNTSGSGGNGSSNHLGDIGDRLGDLIADAFNAWGRFVGRHPGRILIASLVFTLLMAPGIARVRINLDLYKLFVPLDAPVRFEFESQLAYDKMPPGLLSEAPVPPSLIAPPPPPPPNPTTMTVVEAPAASQMQETPVSESAAEDAKTVARILAKGERESANMAASTADGDSGIMEEKQSLSNQVRRSKRYTTKESESNVNTASFSNKTSMAVAQNPAAPIHTDILRFYVVHKNYDNLLVSDTLRDLYDYTNEMMGVRNEFRGQEWVFEDFCKKESAEAKCNNLLNVWLKHAENLFRSNGSRINPNLQLSYPVMYLFNRPKDIGNIIYGVNVTGQKHEIVGARVLTIHWFIAFPMVGEMQAAYFAYRERLNHFWEEKTALSDIKFIPHNDKAMDDELRLIIETAIPYAIPATIQLMFFVYFTNIASDVRKSKPSEAFMGVISVVLSLISTFGIAFYCGLPFNPVSSTMPFLILAVGVDDAFMMLGSWRMTDPRCSVEKRMGEMMSDAGASITVTSLTNFGCFALGYFLSPTPAVADFCVLTALGVFMDYAYQITFFGAVMVYGGYRESEGGVVAYFRCKGKSSLCCTKNSFSPAAVEAQEKASSIAPEEVERQAMESFHQPTAPHRFFRDYYAPFIMKREVKAISWMVFVIYICISFYGCINMRVDISPKKYIRDNSPIQTFVYLADKYIWADNVMPSIHVMRPPDLRNATQRARFNEMVFRLENTKYSIGRVSTNLWIWEYQSFLNDFPEVNYEVDFYKRFYLRNFFNQFDYQQFRGMVKINDSVAEGEPCISAFKFQTSFYGLDSWDKRQAELFHWRRIVAEFPEFEAFLAGIFSPFLIDQRRTIAPSSMQSVGCAIAVMALISMFFLPDRQSVFVMSFSLISISMGVCGFLCLWGSDLDSVSMGCIIMAIGLAVDFSIHICYRYHRCPGALTAEAKVIETLSIVGYPVLQAGTSTLWGMTVLPLIPAYLVRVFFQTVVLVCSFGLIHALLWLPQFISALDPIERVPRRLKHPHGE